MNYFKSFFVFVFSSSKDPFMNATSRVFNVLGNRCYHLELENERKFPNELFQLMNSTSNLPGFIARLNLQGFHCLGDYCYLEVNLSIFFFLSYLKNPITKKYLFVSSHDKLHKKRKFLLSVWYFI